MDKKYISQVKVDDTIYNIKDNEAARIISPEFKGIPKAPTPLNNSVTTQIATIGYVNDAFKANDAMIFKGTIGSSGATVTTLPAKHEQGWTYKVATAGSYAGQNCEAGDMIICITDGTAVNNTHWTVVQTNMTYSNTAPSDLNDTASAGSSAMVARADHVHKKPDLGNITYKGEISVTTEIANGDKILISDSSDNNIIKNSSINFDGSSEDKALTPKGTWGDFYTEPEIDEKLDEKENIIIKNASGSIAHFEDAAEGNAINVKVDFEPKQDLHGYDHPWPALGGKNKYPIICTEDTITKNVAETTYTINNDTFEISPTLDSANSGIYFKQGTSIFGQTLTELINNGYTVTISFDVKTNVDGTRLRYGDSNNSDSFNKTISTDWTRLSFNTDKVITVVFYGYHLTESATIFIKNIMLSIDGSTDYEPYENICPIEGYTGCNITKIGKNLLKPLDIESRTIQGITYTKNENGSYIITGTANSSEHSYFPLVETWAKIEDTCLKGLGGKTITFSGANDDVPMIISLRTSNDEVIGNTGWLNSGTITLPFDETCKIYINLRVTKGKTVNTIVYPQIEIGSEVSSYEPYTETVYPISWESKVGTIYGGSLDVTTGVLTVDRTNVKLLSSWPWVKSSEIGDFYLSSAVVTNILQGKAEINSRILCSHAKFVTSSATKNIGDCWNNNNYHFYIISNDNSLADWKDYLDENDVYICYYLATPQTYQLTPTEIMTLLGINNIWCDIGNISIDYLVESSDKLAKYLSNKLSFDNIPTNNSYNPVYSNGIKTALNDKADNIIKNISGNPVIITDGSIAPVSDLTVEIKPIQDLHGLNNPYPAGGGKNLWNPEWVINGAYPNGSIVKQGTVDTHLSIYAPVIPGHTYTISKNTGGRFRYAFTANLPIVNEPIVGLFEDHTASSLTFEVPENMNYVISYVGYAPIGDIFTDILSSIQIEEGSVATTYEPYENICPITGWTGCNIVKSRVFTPNQFVKNGNFESTSNWTKLRTTISVENNIIKMQGDGQNSVNGIYQNLSTKPIGHIFYATGDVKGDTSVPFHITINYAIANSNNIIVSGTTSTSWETFNGILKYTENSSGNYNFGYRFVTQTSSNRIPDDSYVYLKNAMIIDLTELFGEQVAEQILAMEQVKSGSGVAIIKGFFPKEYYPTNNNISPENDGQGSLYPITFPTEAETVYGGSLDVTTGILTVNRVLTTITSVADDPTASYAVKINLPNAYPALTNNIPAPNLLASYLKTVSNNILATTNDNLICTTQTGNNSYIKIVGLTTRQEYDDYLSDNPLQVVYQLRDSAVIHYQLTSTEVTTLLGGNIVSADTGNINISYRADTKTYIDNIKSSAENSENAIQSMITQSFENDTIATRNYNTGDLLIINNQLLRATEQIYMGSSISGKTSVVDLETIIGEKLDLHGIADSSNSVISIQLTNENLNDLLSENTIWYYASSNNSVTNSPLSTGTAFDLIVYRSASYRKQLLSASVSNIWYERIYQGTKGWTEWEKINYELPIASNDTLGGIKVGQNLTIDDTGKLSSHKSGITKTISGNPVIIPDGVYAPVADLTVNIEPIQDLHGLPNPYPAGGGKNLLKMTVDEIKAINDAGTWTGNSYLNYGVTFTLQLDDDGNVIGITATGISSSNNCDIRILIPSDVERELIVSGGPTTDADAYIYCYDTTNSRRVNDWDGNTTGNSKNGSTINIKPTLNSVSQLRCRVASASEVNNLLYKPMARLRTITDDTFEPSTNICPITGWTGVNITRTGKNLLETVPQSNTIAEITATVNTDGSITINGVANANAVVFWNLSKSSSSSGNINDDTKYFSNGTYHKTPYDGRWTIQIRGSNSNPMTGNDASLIASYNKDSFIIDNTYTYNCAQLWVKKGSSFNNETIYPWIYKSDEVTEYPITFPTEAGMVYSGSLDVTTGVLTVTHEKYEAQNLESILNKTWTKSASATNAFWITATGITNRDTKFSSSHFEYTNQASTYQENYGYCYHDSSLAFNCDPAICGTTVESWKTWLTAQKTLGTPVEVVIELTTPQTYQLTPIEILTLLGNNTISANIGVVNVTYQADIKNYIDEGLNEKLPLTGGTLTGDLIIYQESDTATNTPARIVFKPKDTTTNKVYSNAYIAVYNDHYPTAANGTNMVLHSGGNLYIGSGESPRNLYTSKTTESGESLYITSDTIVHIQGGASNIANRVGVQINSAGNLLPEKADTLVDNSGSIGGVDNRWANLYVTNINSTTLNVTDININNQATIQWNESDESLDFIFT